MKRYSARELRVLAILAALMGGIMILSNILATKLWGINLGFAYPTFDAGLLVYPLTYILCDMLIEFYDLRIANTVSWICAGLNFIALFVMLVGDMLPSVEGVETIVFSDALGLSFWVFTGSSVGFLGNQLLNNFIFVALKKVFGENRLAVRVLGSSLLARVADLVLFNVIAFGIRMSPLQLIKHIGWTYLAGIALEIILYPIVSFIIRAIKVNFKAAS